MTMLETVKLDERGRVTLGTKIAKEYGRRFYAIKAKGEIILIPIPKDPIKALQREGLKLPKDVSLKKLREETKRVIEEEAWNNWVRIQNLSKRKSR